MKDNFSQQSRAYARYRPTYPNELFSFILSHVREKTLAWDCGTGNGQVAEKLSPFFERVYATDLSQNQLVYASKRDNIIYQVMTAEEAIFQTHQFDLITVAQAVHWFDFSRFYQKVRAYLKPGGNIAVFGYGLVKIDPACDKIIKRLYSDILGDYWDPERKYIEAHYRTIPFPFEEIYTPAFKQKMNWSMGHLTGYLNTWSSVRHYFRKHGQNPVELVLADLQEVWGNTKQKEVSFPVFLRMSRVTERTRS